MPYLIKYFHYGIINMVGTMHHIQNKKRHVQFMNKIRLNRHKKMRQPGIEPGSIAWKATMLTFTPPTLLSW